MRDQRTVWLFWWLCNMASYTSHHQVPSLLWATFWNPSLYAALCSLYIQYSIHSCLNPLSELVLIWAVQGAFEKNIRRLHCHLEFPEIIGSWVIWERNMHIVLPMRWEVSILEDSHEFFQLRLSTKVQVTHSSLQASYGKTCWYRNSWIQVTCHHKST